ncbi:MAG: ABC transporter ATP-binding protein [Minwuiales bacterium]|nr:ABC transporter ATP-binding protein [Minwuiales bacterium]
MARIHLDGIAHSYSSSPESDPDWALKTLDQVWEHGGAYALLGPSGCGKTTLLNVISGLVAPTQGRVLFDETDVTGLATERRNIAQVFQFPVIYDTMTVAENLAFPLRNRGVDEATVKTRVAEVADLLDLGGDLNKRARRLTPDAKQKISLGRGLVRSDVAAILFDEPLTVIDPHLKWQLRRKLKEIHERFKLTLVYVTHDQNEALTFADRVAVMQGGRILQVGTPQELFEAPVHRYVGFFIGSPGMNFLPCALDGDDAVVQGQRVPLGRDVLAAAAKRPAEAYELGVRPEFIMLDGDTGPRLEVSVRKVEDLGNFKIVTASVGEHRLKIKAPEHQPVAADIAAVRLRPDMVRLYADGELVG